MNFKRGLSIILCLSMSGLLACGSSGESVVTDTDTGAPESDSAEITSARIEPDLPDKKWEGYEFRVLTKGDANVHWKSKDIAAAEENGDIINDAVYKRNLAVSDRFGVTFVDIPSPDGTWNLTTPARTSILADSDDYDMIAGAPSEVVKNLAPEGLLIDLQDMPYIDLTKPWYDQNSIEQLSICGKVFCTTGDMLIMDDEATLGILFNKQIAEDYNLGDLYEIVKSGKWTLDLMTKMATDVSEDLDNDGKMGYEDQYGLTSEELNTYACMVGCGVQAVVRNGDELEFNVTSEKFIDAFEKSVKMNRDYDITIHSAKISGVSDAYADVIDPAFVSGRIFFNLAGLVRVTHFRSMDIDFGVIPIPKYDEAQEKYYSMVSIPCSDSIAIPVSASDPERTGAIIEALSAEGYYTLKEAYYDTVLKTKGARDEESAEMLDLIFSNRIYDIGYMYNWGSLITSINQLEIGGNVSSTVASKLTVAKTEMEKTIEDYKNLQ